MVYRLLLVSYRLGRMDPKDAFKRITQDWVKFYMDEASITWNKVEFPVFGT